MNSPTCQKCDCVKGCSANPVPCPILLAECIASGQVSAAQIEQHRVLDAPIAQPEQPAMPDCGIKAGESIEQAAEGWAQWCEVRGNQMLANFLRAAIAQPKDKP